MNQYWHRPSRKIENDGWPFINDGEEFYILGNNGYVYWRDNWPRPEEKQGLTLLSHNKHNGYFISRVTLDFKEDKGLTSSIIDYCTSVYTNPHLTITMLLIPFFWCILCICMIVQIIPLSSLSPPPHFASIHPQFLITINVKSPDDFGIFLA